MLFAGGHRRGATIAANAAQRLPTHALLDDAAGAADRAGEGLVRRIAEGQRCSIARGGPAFGALSDPAAASATDSRNTAILHHVDLLTLSPEKATRGDVQKLMSVGLTDQDVVTLTGLIAFVNYQARVVTGLRMLKGE